MPGATGPKLSPRRHGPNHGPPTTLSRSTSISNPTSTSRPTSPLLSPGGRAATTPEMRLEGFAKVLNANEDFVTTVVAGGVTIRYRPAAGGPLQTGEVQLEGAVVNTTTTLSESSTIQSSSSAPSPSPFPSTSSTSTVLSTQSTSFSPIKAAQPSFTPEQAQAATTPTQAPPQASPRPTPSPATEPEAKKEPLSEAAAPAPATTTSSTAGGATTEQAAPTTPPPEPAAASSATSGVSQMPEESQLSGDSAAVVGSTSGSDMPPSTIPLISSSTTTSLPPPLPLGTKTANNALRPSTTHAYPLNTNTAEAANNTDSEGTNKGKSVGAIVGGLFAFFALLALILFIVRWYKRRNKSDREALMRSSWFYGGDVDMPDEEEEKNSRFNGQSRFSAPSVFQASTHRLSNFATPFLLANLNPFRKSRRFSQYGAGMTEGYNPNTDVPRPISTSAVPAGKGGWASRFFDAAPDNHEGQYRGEGGDQYHGDPEYGQPEMVSRTSPVTRPSIDHPFAASADANQATEGQWGRSYSPETAPSPARAGSYAPTRDLLLRNPDSSSSAYTGMAIPPSNNHALQFPIPHRPGSDQSGMEMLSTTPVTAEFTSAAPAKAAILAKLNSHPSAQESLRFGINNHSSNQFEFASRGVSMVDTTSVYSTNTNTFYPVGEHGVISALPTGTAYGGGREVETMYSQASSGVEPDQSRYTRGTYVSGASGGWTNMDDGTQGASGRETRDWYSQSGIWDETLARNASEAAGMSARKSVKSVRWGDGPVDDGLPRAL